MRIGCRCKKGAAWHRSCKTGQPERPEKGKFGSDHGASDVPPTLLFVGCVARKGLMRHDKHRSASQGLAR
jgi:hypothetical protein